MHLQLEFVVRYLLKTFQIHFFMGKIIIQMNLKRFYALIK